MTHIFRHPNYYKQIKKNQAPSDDKKDTEPSSEEATGSSEEDNPESTSASD